MRCDRRALSLILAIAASATTALAAGYDDARYRVMSAPDCIDATNILAEYAPAPRNATYMRVQHMGDLGTPELAGQIAGVVTWDVGTLSGYSVPPELRPRAQRGYRNFAPPNHSSAFQLWCNGAGFVIDSRRFPHTEPIILAGPSVSVARELDPPAAMFGNATSALTIDGRVSVPWVSFDSPPFVDGTAQVSFFYYVRDTTSGITFAHLIALFDNRSRGTNGVGREEVSADSFTPYVVSPLLDTAEFVTASATSAQVQYVAGWPDARFFRAHVTYPQFEAMLARIERETQLGLSLRPEDYRVTLFGLLGEIFPGTGNASEVGLGASVTDLMLSEAYYDVAPVKVIEYHHAAFDHYFMTAHPLEIEALDSGRLAGWTRTGDAFDAYASFVSGMSPVCRFRLPPAIGDSHFFSASPSECAEVATKFPEFVPEDDKVMYMALPDALTGACPPGSSAVYRLWNARSATNHRYTTSAAKRQAMIAAGWVPEGYGPLAVAMCTP